MILFSDRVPTQLKLYNAVIRENPMYRVLPRLQTTTMFRTHYRSVRRFFAQEFPWCLVREGQTVMQVGAAKDLLITGRSQPLILSTLVGPRGRVIVVEPDLHNVVLLREYLRTNRVTNVTVIQKGAWSAPGRTTLTVAASCTSANILSQGCTEGYRSRNLQRPGIAEHVSEVEVEVETIDRLLEEHAAQPVSFINITINGCEWEAIQGMPETLRGDVIISFPIQNPRTFQSPVLESLERQGFTIFVRHAPVRLSQPQFLVACAVKQPSRAFLDQGGWQAVKLVGGNGMIRVVPVGGA